MANIEIYYKQTPMHESVYAGMADKGDSIQETFATLDADIIASIKENMRVHVSNPDNATRVIEPGDWGDCKLTDSDRVTLIGIPGALDPITIAYIIIAVLVVVIAVTLRPVIPKQDSDAGQRDLHALGGENNATPYDPIPSVYGTIRVPLKYIAYPSGQVGYSSTPEPPKLTFRRTGGGLGKGNNNFGGIYELIASGNQILGRNSDTDYLSILGTFGAGPMEIKDIKVGDVDLLDLNAEFQIYDGSAEFAPNPPRFYSGTRKSEHLLSSINGTDMPDEDWIEFTTLNNPARAKFDLGFPAGHYKVGRKNRRFRITTKFDYQWKDVDEEWVGAHNTRSFGYFNGHPFFASINIEFGNQSLPHGASVRIRRVGISGEGQRSDQTQLVRFQSERDDEPNYLPHNYSIMSARIKADARVNNNLPVVTALVSRKVLDYSNYNPTVDVAEGIQGAIDAGAIYAATSNPAWIYLDALSGLNQENRIKRNQVDWQAFKDWAIFCDETTERTYVSGENYSQPKGSYNAVIDKSVTLERLLKSIAASGYASPRMRGTLFSVFWEATERLPIGLLTPATIGKFSYSKDWPDEVHGYRVSYSDPENDYKSNQIIAYADGYNDVRKYVGAEQFTFPDVVGYLRAATIIKSLDGRKIGCVSIASAWRYGRYKIADDILHTDQYQCEISVDGLFFEAGDVVNLSHDVIKVGQLSGRVEYASEVHDNLSPYNDLNTGGNLLPTNTGHSLLKRTGGEQMAGMQLGIAILDQPIPDALFEGENWFQEIQVEGVFGLQKGYIFPMANFGFDLFGFPLPAAGHLYNQVTGDITSQASFNARAVLTLGLPTDLQGVEYSIGAANKTSIPVVIHRIAPSGEYKAQIAMQDFKGSDLIASWTGDVPNRLAVFDDRSTEFASFTPDKPIILVASSGEQKPIPVNGRIVSNVFIFLEPININIKNNLSDIIVQWKLSDELLWNTNQYEVASDVILIDVPVGATYDVRIAVRSVDGAQSDFATATLINNINDRAITDRAPTIESMEIEGQGNNNEFFSKGVIVVWTDSAHLPDSDERIGANFGGGVVDTSFDGYNVRVKDIDGNILIDWVRVYQPRFEYSPDLESFVAKRDLIFEVERQNINGGRSEINSFQVTNPKPDVPMVAYSQQRGLLKLEITPEAGTLSAPDFKEIIVMGGVVGQPEAVLFRGYNNPISLSFGDITAGVDITTRVAIADSFATLDDDWNYSAPIINTIEPDAVVVDSAGELVPITANVPPTPTGLVITPLVNHTILEFDNPRTIYDAHGKTEIFRGSNPQDLGIAVKIGETTGVIYLDGATSPGVIYNYWIRYASASGVVGVFNAVDGTTAHSRLIDGDAVEHVRADSITTGRLTAAQINTDGLEADRIRAGSVIETPILEAAIIRHPEGVAGRFVGSRIEGAIIIGSTIITGGSALLGIADPPVNTDDQDLSALLDEVAFNGAGDIYDSGNPDTPNPAVFWFLNPWVSELLTSTALTSFAANLQIGSDRLDPDPLFRRDGNAVIMNNHAPQDPLINPTGTYLYATPTFLTSAINIVASNYNDPEEHYRYRYPRVNPMCSFDIPFAQFNHSRFNGRIRFHPTIEFDFYILEHRDIHDTAEAPNVIWGYNTTAPLVVPPLDFEGYESSPSTAPPVILPVTINNKNWILSVGFDNGSNGSPDIEDGHQQVLRGVNVSLYPETDNDYFIFQSTDGYISFMLRVRNITVTVGRSDSAVLNNVFANPSGTPRIDIRNALIAVSDTAENQVGIPA